MFDATSNEGTNQNYSKLISLRRRLHQQRIQATIVTYNASLAACRSEDALSLLSEAETWLQSGESSQHNAKTKWFWSVKLCFTYMWVGNRYTHGEGDLIPRACLAWVVLIPYLDIHWVQSVHKGSQRQIPSPFFGWFLKKLKEN